MSHLKIPLLILLIFNCVPTKLTAQPIAPKDYGLKEFSIKDSSLGLIRFYVDVENINIKQPLFIDVNGSGGLPLCIYIKGKGFSATFNTFSVPLKDATKKQFHYIILDKPGTPFCDSILTDDDAEHYDKHALVSNYKFSKEYSKRLSLGWRVAATKKVITYLIQHGFWDGTQIVADGYSEGGQVVPSLAVADKRVTHIVAAVGSGLNQFYDGILAWRIKAAKGKITQQQAQDSINAELKIIKDIYLHPENTKLEYAGHTYKRWASFGLNPPFEKLRMLNIPIYMIVSTADDNSPIYGLDYVELDFIRLGKTNLIYDTCVGCDHYFNRTDTSSTAGNGDFNAKILKWLGK
jgi:hypothetical protein